MYKMIIVEDEEIERRYLCKFIEWESMGIEVVAALESGEEALEFANGSEVDILLTDIKLIGMSGLQLAKELLRRKPDLKVVILSGYQEFDYAKEAVELQAFSFLTKPVDKIELENVFIKVATRCFTEESDKLEKARLYKLVEQNMPVLKSKFYEDLINGRLTEQEIYSGLDYFRLKMKANWYDILVTEVDSFEALTADMEPLKKHLLIVEILDNIRLFDEFNTNITFHLNEGKYCTILSMDVDKTESLYGDAFMLAQKLQEHLNTQLNLEITIGIGKGVSDLTELKTSYKKACEAVAFKFYMGNNQVIHYKDVNYDENSSIVDWDETEKQIVTSIGLCDGNNLEIGLNKLFSDIKANSCSDTYIRNISINLVSKVSVMLLDMHESYGKVFGNETLVWDKLLKIDTVFNLQLWLKNIFNGVIEYLTSRKNGCNKRIINEILKYIDTNYHKNISIVDLSREVYLSPNYISIIFKKEMGEVFTNFLIRFRMEKAIKMLKESNLKVYEIGDHVGYPNTSHFCTVFKKLYGVSPNEFREKI
jgi:two-component system, response regulator YesN